MLVFLIVGVDDVAGELLLCLRCQFVVLFLQHETADFQQLLWRVVVEVEDVGEARFQSGVGLQQMLHLGCVASHDDNHVGLFHTEVGQKCFNDSVTEILTVRVLHEQIVGLIDEKHAARCAFDGVEGVLLGVAQILPDQFRTVGFHQMPRRQHTHAMIDFAYQFGHGRLACSRIASEHHVHGRHVVEEPQFHTPAVQVDQTGVRHDTLLDVVQTDERT